MKRWILKQSERVIEAIRLRSRRSTFWRWVGPPFQILAGEIHLLFSENALALPVGNEWAIYTLPFFKKSRLVPRITSMPGSLRTLHGSRKHASVMKEFYSYKDFLEVEQGDVVVDIGAHVGGFTLSAAPEAEQVIAIEPSATVFDALEFNTRHLDNVTVVKKAAWKESTTLNLNCSEFPSENSIFTPDTGAADGFLQVPAEPVPDMVRELGFDRIDFLKVEAEGAEPEILRRTLEDSMPVRKVVIDVSPEREEESVEEEITTVLEEYGYEWKQKSQARFWEDQFVFAKKPGDAGAESND